MKKSLKLRQKGGGEVRESLTLSWRSRLAPALISASTIAVWPLRAAVMRAVSPSCGHAQAEEQHRGGAPETVSPRPENRHTAPGALPLLGEPGPLPVGARLGGLWGGACFFALKCPFPPSRPSTRPQLGATALKFHKICTTRSATRAPWRSQQPWATFFC